MARICFHTLKTFGQHGQVALCRSGSTWSDVQMGPPDVIFGIVEAFKKCPNENKINLSVGAYRDDKGKPYVLPSVREAERRVIAKTLDKEYAGIVGVGEFVKLTAEFAFGEESRVVRDGLNATVQSLSGTGALRLGGAFLSSFYPRKEIYLPAPTWGNHNNIFKHSGLAVKQYRYYDKSTIGLDLKGMLDDLSSIPDGSAVLLHACAHNPTGIDPSPEQWAEISELVKRKGHYIFFDMAYQGFASGDVDRDASAVRRFIDDGHDLILAQSYAKNMGLYGERIGGLSIVCRDRDEKERVMSQLKIIVRGMYSNPPIHGARLVAEILGDRQLRSQWQTELKGMADRIIGARRSLKEELVAAGSQRSWEHITGQIGMFCYTGLSPEQVEALTSQHHVFLTKDGRVSMAGVTSGNVQRLAQAIHQVTK